MANTLNRQDGFGKPQRDSSWSNIWAGRYEPNQISSGTATNTLLVGLTGTKYGQYIYSNGTEWAVGGVNVSLGTNAGSLRMPSVTGSIAIGVNAGKDQDANTVAIGYSAGEHKQQISAISIGYNAGTWAQGPFGIAVGYASGYTGQGNASVAIGYEAGSKYQQQNAIAIGCNAGTNTQGSNSIAIGYNAGNTDQSSYSIIIGSNSRNNSTAINSIAIGNSNTVNAYSVALGNKINTKGETGCIVLSSSDTDVTCLKSNQIVIAGVNTSDPNINGSLPVLEKLPAVTPTGSNIWLPVQIGNVSYCIPLFPQ